jgi:deoxycytidine triphosphate deaminase/plasmid maintenance system antidote protein VapI
MTGNVTAIHSGAGEQITFGQVLSQVLQFRHKNQSQLALGANISQSYVSKLISGERDLTEGLAEKFANFLGGSPGEWMLIFRETKAGHARPLTSMLATLFGDNALGGIPGQHLGSNVRQLRSDAIKQVFDPAHGGRFAYNGKEEDCEIEHFEPERVSVTSYDTRAGNVGRFENGAWNGEPFAGAVIIPPGKHKYIGTLECVALPSWLEAEIHPASNIALKPLIVSHGPVIDPGWHGRLYVTVFNPTDTALEISDQEPFLTLRFWVADQER